MLQLGEYTIGWLVYIAAAIGALLVCWRLFRGVPWQYVRRILWISSAVLLLTPTVAVENYWAPAWIIGSLEAALGDVEAALPAARILLIAWLSSLIAYTLIAVLFLRGRGNDQELPEQTRSTDKKTSRRKTPRRITPRI